MKTLILKSNKINQYLQSQQCRYFSITSCVKLTNSFSTTTSSFNNLYDKNKKCNTIISSICGSSILDRHFYCSTVATSQEQEQKNATTKKSSHRHHQQVQELFNNLNKINNNNSNNNNNNNQNENDNIILSTAVDENSNNNNNQTIDPMHDFTTTNIISNISSITSTHSKQPIDSVSSPSEKSSDDLEIKDPNIIFNTVWNKLEQRYGKENMRFPQEIIYLMGAPGSGKGTNTPFISSVRGITAAPIVMSSLLNNAEARRIKAQGGMVNDSFVFHTILEELRKVEYRSGVVVDGFPRTNIQVECINALYEKMKELRKSYFNTPQASCFPRPVFRVTVLFVEEKESVDRQIRRGQITRETNIKLKEQGLPLLEERDTDTSEDAARKRYKIFKDHYSTLQTLKKHFPFSIIDASKAIGEVQQSIIKEFKYQSSLELAEETYDMVQRIPLVTDITDHARVDLVTRLDEYQFRHTDLFASVINIIDREFIPTIRRHSIAGSATMRIINRIFSNPLAVDMALDVLSERGFRATVDVRSTHIPHKINPATMEIETITQNEYMFKVDFQAPLIRLENTSHFHPKMGKS